jgi:hypothetical protein
MGDKHSAIARKLDSSGIIYCNVEKTATMAISTKVHLHNPLGKRARVKTEVARNQLLLPGASDGPSPFCMQGAKRRKFTLGSGVRTVQKEKKPVLIRDQACAPSAVPVKNWRIQSLDSSKNEGRRSARNLTAQDDTHQIIPGRDPLRKLTAFEQMMLTIQRSNEARAAKPIAPTQSRQKRCVRKGNKSAVGQKHTVRTQLSKKVSPDTKFWFGPLKASATAE